VKKMRPRRSDLDALPRSLVHREPFAEIVDVGQITGGIGDVAGCMDRRADWRKLVVSRLLADEDELDSGRRDGFGARYELDEVIGEPRGGLGVGAVHTYDDTVDIQEKDAVFSHRISIVSRTYFSYTIFTGSFAFTGMALSVASASVRES
jgi:hypothetical protein